MPDLPFYFPFLTAVLELIQIVCKIKTKITHKAELEHLDQYELRSLCHDIVTLFERVSSSRAPVVMVEHCTVSSCQFLFGVHHGDLEVGPLFLTPGGEVHNISVHHDNDLLWQN